MPQVLTIQSIDALRAAAPAWNDLWQRSDCTSPLARAEPVADWLAHFAPDRRFEALVVADADHWLVALPLVERRMAGVLRAGVLPCSAWPSGATLLWDTSATDDASVAAAVSAAAASLPWPLVFLEAAMPARASWQALHRTLRTSELPCDLRTRWHVGRLAIQHDWPSALGRLSRRHRQRMSACLRKLQRRGEVRFEVHAHLAPEQVEPLLCRAWQTEDRGWKGAAGTSVLRVPGAAKFMLAQARCLAADGRLLLAFLDCGQASVAFSYGALGKGVFHSFKIGFDPAFAALSPGHLLQYHLLKALHADPQVAAVDYIGEITAYHTRWRPEVYPFARLAFARHGSLLGRTALWGVHRIKGPSEELPVAAPQSTAAQST
jgi:CelD/BcsL family acetyltransferase involved in cellulose biosynthesis